jgi:hypothetical protein
MSKLGTRGKTLPQGVLQKLESVTKVTLHWDAAGIQFRALRSSENGRERPRARALEPALRLIAGKGYGTTPRRLPGSCIRGVPLCI